MEDSFLRQVDAAFGCGDFREAAQLCRQCLARDPSSVVAWRRLGSCQLEMDEYAGAVHSFEEAIRLDPRQMRHSGLGLALHGLGDNVAAAEAFKQSLKLREDPSAYVYLAQIQYDLGLLADSEASSRRALDLSPDEPEAMFSLGRALGSTEPDAARSWFRQAVKLDPEYAAAHRELGANLLRRTKSEAPPAASETRAQAIDSLLTSLQYDASNSWSHAYLATAYDIEGRLEDAEREYLRACAVAKEGAWSHHQIIGNFYRSNDRLEEAETHLRMSIELDPDRAKTSYWLGLALLQQGKKSEAAIWLQRTLSLHPDEATKEEIVTRFLPEANEPNE